MRGFTSAQQQVIQARRVRVEAWIREGKSIRQTAQLEFGATVPTDTHLQTIRWDTKQLGIEGLVVRPGPWEAKRESQGEKARVAAALAQRAAMLRSGDWGPPDADGISGHLPCKWKGCAGCGGQGGRRVPVEHRRARAEDFASVGGCLGSAVSGLPRAGGR